MHLEEDIVIAQDPATSEDVLLKLSNHESADVRSAVAKNIASPKGALINLFVEFPEEVISNPASAMFDLEESALAWIPSSLKVEVARSKGASAFVLEALLNDPDSDVRAEIAENPNTEERLLDVLAKDTDVFVRPSVAKNENTSTSSLRILAKDSESSVRVEVARNARTPTDVLKDLSMDRSEFVATAALGMLMNAKR